MYIPESALGPHRQVLQHKPKSWLGIRVLEFGGIHAKTTNEVPREHASSRARWGRDSYGHRYLGCISSSSVNRGIGVGSWLTWIVGALGELLMGRIGTALVIVLNRRVGHVDGRTFRRGWVRSSGTTADGHGWCSAAVANQVDLTHAVGVPEVHSENKEGAINIVGVDFQAGVGIGDNQSYAGRGRNGTTILLPRVSASTTLTGQLLIVICQAYLVSEPTHSGANRLLTDHKSV